MEILEFFGEPLSYGGQEAFILNMYKKFSKNNKYYFCTPFNADNQELLALIKERDDMLYSSKYIFNSKLRKMYIYLTAKDIISDKYDVIHIHSGSIMTLLLVSIIAKKRSVKKIIVHSHATGYMTFSHRLIKMVSDRLIVKSATEFMACSNEAGKYKFPDSVIKSEKFIIIKNGIDLKKFIFNSYERKRKRKTLGLNGKKVLCHVGRFSEEKNHVFIIRVFLEYLKLEENGVLMLVGGSGEEEKKIREIISKNNISDKVIILKNRKDIPELLWASDVFIFPSKFEGLGIAAIEAQASGLPTIVASHLPVELNASHNYFTIDLKNNPEEWAKKAYELQNCERTNCYLELKKSGFDIEDCSKKLEKIYTKD